MRGALIVNLCPFCGEAQFTFPVPDTNKNVSLAIRHADFLRMLAGLMKQAENFHSEKATREAGHMPIRCCQAQHGH
jgi:hypothetical protein